MLLSLAIGIPIGVLAGRRERFHRAITPALDAMQIVPAFAYLMPIVILFSVGPGAAVICTMIYAIPPAVRITALGIRGVTKDSVEAAQAFGSTPAQTLFKVQLPLARRQLLLSVNQTIMFALSLVVIAGLIGGKGLGDVVTNGLYSNAALAILAGIAIVIMAIALDRATAAIAERTDPTRQHLTDERRRHARRMTLATFGLIAVIVVVARRSGADALYPDEFETVDHGLHGHDRRRPAGLDPGRARLRAGPELVHLRDHRADRELPAREVPRAAAEVPRRGAVVHRARRLHRDRVRAERTAARRSPRFLMLIVIGVIGVWAEAMDTASQVLVATALAVFFGILIGVWAAESPRVERRCGHCSTRSRRCRSSSTSSRSST